MSTSLTKAPSSRSDEFESRSRCRIYRAVDATPGMIAIRSESLFGSIAHLQTFDDDVGRVSSRRTLSPRRVTRPSWPACVSRSFAPEYTRPLGEIYQYRPRATGTLCTSCAPSKRSVSCRLLSGSCRRRGRSSARRVSPRIPRGCRNPRRLQAYWLALSDRAGAHSASRNTNVAAASCATAIMEWSCRGVGSLRSASESRTNRAPRRRGGTPIHRRRRCARGLSTCAARLLRASTTDGIIEGFFWLLAAR